MAFASMTGNGTVDTLFADQHVHAYLRINHDHSDMYVSSQLRQ